MHILYIFAACFLPLITFGSAHSNFHNITTPETFVSQSFQDRELNSSAYFEKRQVGINHKEIPYYTVGKVRDFTATVINAEGWILTLASAFCDSHKKVIPGVGFTVVGCEGDIRLDPIVLSSKWHSQTYCPESNIGFAKLDGHRSLAWMNMKDTPALSLGQELKIMGYKDNEISESKGKVEKLWPQLRIRTDLYIRGAIVYDEKNNLFGLVSQSHQGGRKRPKEFLVEVARFTEEELNKMQTQIDEFNSAVQGP